MKPIAKARKSEAEVPLFLIVLGLTVLVPAASVLSLQHPWELSLTVGAVYTFLIWRLGSPGEPTTLSYDFRKDKSELKAWLEDTEIQAQKGETFAAVVKDDQLWLLELEAEHFIGKRVSAFYKSARALHCFAKKSAARREQEETRFEKLKTFSVQRQSR